MATPPEALWVAVPLSTPPPPLAAAFKDRVTLELSVVTVLPYWSSTVTATPVIVRVPSVLVGWVVNASCAAGPGVTSKGLEVAVPPTPAPLALKV